LKGGSCDFGLIFMHFYAFITGTDSFWDLNPEPPKYYAHATTAKNGRKPLAT